MNPYASPASDLTPVSSRRESKANALDAALVVLLGLCIPGLPALIMKRPISGIAMLLTVPAAFAFFGPFWGEYLFAGTRISEHGFYPFIVVLIATPLASVFHGLAIRRELLQEETELDFE